MSIGEKAAQGFFSILTRNVLARFMGLFSMIVLARKLSPADFGLVSITEVLLNFIAVFGVTGVFEFLVSYRGKDRDEINQSAFWFNILMALAIVAILNLAAPFWAESNGDERIVALSLLISGIFLTTSLQILPKSILSQRMDFAAQARVQNPFIILIPAGKIACAYLGFGVYSLLIPTLIFGIVQTLLFYRVVAWKFQWSWYAKRWKEIYAFTRHLIGTTLLTRITEDGDKFILGKFLGLEALGIYNLANQLAQLFTSNVGTITNQIFAAAFPKYAHDKRLMLEHFLLVTKVIAFFSFPIMCWMAVAADPLISLIYTEKWSAAVLPFQILTLFAIFRSITSAYGAVVNSLLVPQIAFYPFLVYTPIHLGVSLLCGQYSIVAMAIGVVTVKLLFVQYRIFQLVKLLGTSFKNFYLNLAPVLLATGISSLIGIAAAALPLTHNFGKFTIISMAFALAFWSCIQLFGKQYLDAIHQFFLKTTPKLGVWFGHFFRLRPADLPLG